MLLKFQIQWTRLMSSDRASFENLKSWSKLCAELKISSVRNRRRSSKSELNLSRPKTLKWSMTRKYVHASSFSNKKRKCWQTSARKKVLPLRKSAQSETSFHSQRSTWTKSERKLAIHQLCKSSKNWERSISRFEAPYRQRMPLSKGRPVRSKVRSSSWCQSREPIWRRSRNLRDRSPPKQTYLSCNLN